jgi:hypothetical protein
VRGYGGFGRLGRHRSCPLSPGSARPGIAGAAARARPPGISGAGRAKGSDGGYPGRMEREWVTRLRWRMRGAWLWPPFASDPGRRAGHPPAAVLRRRPRARSSPPC